jgi:hypothetical protein
MPNSLPEPGQIPALIARRGLTLRFIYNGRSMHPTFRPGQILYVRPQVEALRPGDVIVYQDEVGCIVHRVCSIVSGQIITRGDNNRTPDTAPLPLDRLIGRVEMAQADRIRPVVGGRLGLLTARLRWAGLPAVNSLRIVFGWPYRRLKASHLMLRLWKPQIEKVHLQTDNGPRVKYLYNRRTVAVWDPLPRRFECRKPFDLILFPPQDPL